MFLLHALQNLFDAFIPSEFLIMPMASGLYEVVFCNCFASSQRILPLLRTHRLLNNQVFSRPCMGVWLNMGREHWSRSIPERHATQHMVALRLRLLLLISLFIHNITYQPQNTLYLHTHILIRPKSDECLAIAVHKSVVEVGFV